jgi:hypothetical protein
MSTETGELALTPGGPRAATRGAEASRLRAGRLPLWDTGATAEGALEASEHAAALRDCWRALWSSRLLVWAAGAGTVAALGLGPARKVIQHAQLTHGFGWLGNLLVAPAARWDAGWYLLIVRQGYKPELGAATAPRGAFFPLYPMLVRALSTLLISPVVAGVLVSTLALALALYGLHRLTALETGTREVARLAVLLTAFAPMAFFFSAIYGESLYLALSVGVFWYARKGRWAVTGVLGVLASATRPTGVLLAAPALILYLYGPRQDRPPDRSRRGAPAGDPGPVAQRQRGLAQIRKAAGIARPRYRLRPDLLWLAVMPLGAGLFAAYLGLAGGDAATPFHSQQLWGRYFDGPFGGVWSGAVAAFDGLRQLVSLQAHHSYFAQAAGSPLVSASHNVLLFVFAIGAAVAVVGTVRKLPAAYGAYVLLALALPLSYPVSAEPLMSLPRFLVVLFPLSMWFGGWLAAHPRLRGPLIAASALSMAFFTGAFASWHWVA